MLTYVRDCEYHMAECMVLNIKSTKYVYGGNDFSEHNPVKNCSCCPHVRRMEP